MSEIDYIDDTVDSAPAVEPISDSDTDTDSAPAQPEMDQVVITMPAKLKRAIVAVVNFVRSLFTGEIIINPTVSKGYDYLAYIAFLMLISIITLFSSLHMEIRENRLSEQVRLLGERAVRTEEQRVKATSHSAIVKALAERGIELNDCHEPVTIINTQK